jgi:protein-tyrosine phosphatase
MKKNVLFVCWGNICRSPSAEAVFVDVLKKANLSDDFYVDSAGTIAAHSGERADARMRQHAQKRGYQLESISRKVNPEVDFDKFDYIVAMDDSNMSDLLYLARNEQDEKKLSKMTDYCSSFENTSVPDPYYGGSSGFELVLDLLEDASE